jgi:DHA1 family tetracycline resistance protein-like MFS transporter
VHFLTQLAHVVLPSTFVLYAGYRLGWNERDVGLALAGYGVCFMVVQAGLTGRMVRRFGERTMLIVGLVFGVAGFCIMAFAYNDFWAWLSIPVTSSWGFAGPSLQSLMSRRVSASEQGQLQGASGSLQGIASLVGPVLFTAIFAYAIGPGRTFGLPGAAFLAAAVLLATALALAAYVARAK